MRRIVIAVLATALGLSLTACGAGLNASTREFSQVTDGVEGSITTAGNDIKLVNLLIVEVPGGAGVLVATIVNSQVSEDALLGVKINGAVANVTGTNTLAQNMPIRFEGESANAKAVVTVLNAKAGSHVQVTMFFAHAGEITLLAIVRDKSGTYSGITA